MADLFEHSETPVVITERDRVIIANLSARTLLGSHIVGQDVRMALRQPEAIRLLARDNEGGAVVRGLNRRTDIWRINRKTLPGGLAVIEFVNKTAEADWSALLDYRAQAPFAREMHPTDEHWTPFYFAAGAAVEEDASVPLKAMRLHGSVTHGHLALDQNQL